MMRCSCWTGWALKLLMPPQPPWLRCCCWPAAKVGPLCCPHTCACAPSPCQSGGGLLWQLTRGGVACAALRTTFCCPDLVKVLLCRGWVLVTGGSVTGLLIHVHCCETVRLASPRWTLTDGTGWKPWLLRPEP